MSVLLRQFELFADESLDWQASYNIAPTQLVLAARRTEDGRRELTKLKWGLVPSWAKDPGIGSSMINARSETIFEKPAFRTAIKRRRCIIFADGYYEWQAREEGKQPFLISTKDQPIFPMAGIWEYWEKPEGVIVSCSAITTESTDSIKELHDRMPVILKPDAIDVWLNPATEVSAIQTLMKPYESEQMTFYPVSKLVNSPRNNSPECVDRISQS